MSTFLNFLRHLCLYCKCLESDWDNLSCLVAQPEEWGDKSRCRGLVVRSWQTPCSQMKWRRPGVNHRLLLSLINHGRYLAVRRVPGQSQSGECSKYWEKDVSWCSISEYRPFPERLMVAPCVAANWLEAHWVLLDATLTLLKCGHFCWEPLVWTVGESNHTGCPKKVPL